MEPCGLDHHLHVITLSRIKADRKALFTSWASCRVVWTYLMSFMSSGVNLPHELHVEWCELTSWASCRVVWTYLMSFMSSGVNLPHELHVEWCELTSWASCPVVWTVLGAECCAGEHRWCAGPTCRNNNNTVILWRFKWQATLSIEVRQKWSRQNGLQSTHTFIAWQSFLMCMNFIIWEYIGVNNYSTKSPRYIRTPKNPPLLYQFIEYRGRV